MSFGFRMPAGLALPCMGHAWTLRKPLFSSAKNLLQLIQGCAIVFALAGPVSRPQKETMSEKAKTERYCYRLIGSLGCCLEKAECETLDQAAVVFNVVIEHEFRVDGGGFAVAHAIAREASQRRTFGIVWRPVEASV